MLLICSCVECILQDPSPQIIDVGKPKQRFIGLSAVKSENQGIVGSSLLASFLGPSNCYYTPYNLIIRMPVFEGLDDIYR